MLQKLYEQIDDKVLTADVRETLEREFAAAVESKASAIADSRVEEIEAELHEQQQQHIRELDEAAAEYQRQLEAELHDRYADADNELTAHKQMLNEKAQQYIDERLAEIDNQVDLYASHVADAIVEESKDSIKEGVVEMKARAMYSALETFAGVAGHALGLEIDKAAQRSDDEYNDKISALIEDNQHMKKEIKSLKNRLLFEHNTSDMSMYQRERMRMSLAGLIDTAEEEDLIANLMNIKESFKSEPELEFKPKRQGEISDLLFKNI